MRKAKQSKTKINKKGKRDATKKKSNGDEGRRRSRERNGVGGESGIHPVIKLTTRMMNDALGFLLFFLLRNLPNPTHYQTPHNKKKTRGRSRSGSLAKFRIFFNFLFFVWRGGIFAGFFFRLQDFCMCDVHSILFDIILFLLFVLFCALVRRDFRDLRSACVDVV